LLAGENKVHLTTEVSIFHRKCSAI